MGTADVPLDDVLEVNLIARRGAALLGAAVLLVGAERAVEVWS